jgi:hypothetical protein
MVIGNLKKMRFIATVTMLAFLVKLRAQYSATLSIHVSTSPPKMVLLRFRCLGRNEFCTSMSVAGMGTSVVCWCLNSRSMSSVTRGSWSTDSCTDRQRADSSLRCAAVASSLVTYSGSTGSTSLGRPGNGRIFSSIATHDMMALNVWMYCPVSKSWRYPVICPCIGRGES